MTCDEVRQLLDTEEDDPRLVEHLAACPSCAERIAGEAALWRAFGESIVTPAELWPATAARIREKQRRRVAARLIAAAVAAAIVTAALLVMKERTPPPSERPIANAVVRRAEQQYLDAFRLLGSEERAGGIALDPRAVTQLDEAIAAARVAVVADPHDAVAVAKWRHACDRKVDWLRKAVEKRS